MWHYKSTTSSGDEVEERLTEMLGTFSEFIIEDSNKEVYPGEDNDVDEDEDDKSCQLCEDEEPDAEEEQEEITSFITAEELANLSSALVLSPAGGKISLEFEDVGEEDSVDVLLDNGSVIIDNVSSLRITVTPSTTVVDFHDGEEWHDFNVKKLPKSWLKVIKVNTVYGVGRDKKNSEEE
jgi:hypothetical protein